MTQRKLATDVLESLLLASDRALPESRLAGVIPHARPQDIAGMVEALNADYEASGRAFRIRKVAGGYRLYTQPEYQSYIEALAVTTREMRLSQAALETLAVIAYRQPVSRSDVEYVRGCDCDGVVRTLLGRRLITIKGRSSAPGRPLLYATTDRFLEYFGLASLDDLPDFSEIAALVEQPEMQVRLKLVQPFGAEADADSTTPAEATGDEADTEPVTESAEYPGESPAPSELEEEPVVVAVSDGSET